jgi:hypothetical protein
LRAEGEAIRVSTVVTGLDRFVPLAQLGILAMTDAAMRGVEKLIEASL